MGFKTKIKMWYFLSQYHRKEPPSPPGYKSLNELTNKSSGKAAQTLQAPMMLNQEASEGKLKFTDATRIPVCKNKRIFNHKVADGVAKKGKSSMGWFFGFKLHVVCNDLIQILNLRITPGNSDDRKGLEMIWNKILGTIIADTGYVGKNWQKKAQDLGKKLFTAVRANMKKLMTKAQHNLLKMRQLVETVFSVLKHRMNLETTLPRSELGYFAHYIWCISILPIQKILRSPLI